MNKECVEMINEILEQSKIISDSLKAVDGKHHSTAITNIRDSNDLLSCSATHLKDALESDS
tara:strand:- start:117 stop:299 length:183 start_codon:yes stop_codon:yes gene_type:complete